MSKPGDTSGKPVEPPANAANAGLVPPPTQATKIQGSPVPLAGTWAVNFNGYRGQLTVGADGRATLNLDSGAETLTDVRYDSVTGNLTFTRPLPTFGPGQKQVYTGRLTRPGLAEGKFDCTVSGSGLTWTAQQTAKAPARLGQTGQKPEDGGQPATPAAEPKSIFNNWNTGGAGVGPAAPTTFAIDRPLRVTYVNSYHHNYGRGTKAGTLALRHSDGSLYGAWDVKGSVASGAPNGLWECEPGITLKPGTYTVVDSDPATWSCNGQSGGRGFAEVRGVWATARDLTPATPAMAPTPASAAAVPAMTGKSFFTGELGAKWDKLQAAGGNFDAFARCAGGALVVDVPAGNSWGKTGIMSHEPTLKVGAQPMSVIVRLDPTRTTGVCVTFAAALHPDVYVLQNAWFSWIRTPAAVQADVYFGNTQNGNDGHLTEQIAPAVPTELVFTFQPGRASVLLPDGRTRSINLGWLKEGTPLFTHVFSHPTEANRPAKFALTGLAVAPGAPAAPTAPPPAATTQGAGIPIGGLGDIWDKLQSAGGNFDAFARFDRGALVVDVPAGNSWGKTGIMSRERLFTLGGGPMHVTVRLDPSRTTGVCVTFASSPHPDVYVLQNVWFSWTRPASAAQASLWFGNTQNSSDGSRAELLAPLPPAELTFTLQPGRASVRLPDGKTRTIDIGWLKPGTPVFAHVFSHPADAHLPAKFALTRFDVAVGALPSPTVPTTPLNAATTALPVGALGDIWAKLQAAGGNFDAFARFDRGTLVVDVPAGNSWGKTGIMSRERMFTLGKEPISVAVKIDPARTSGFCIAFAASPHPDVWVLQNAWLSRTVPPGATEADFYFGNTQNGGDGHATGKLAATAPAELVFTLQPGHIELRLPGGKTHSIAIAWMKEGTPIFGHFFTHPAAAGLPAKLAVTGVTVSIGTPGAAGTSLGK